MLACTAFKYKYIPYPANSCDLGVSRSEGTLRFRLIPPKIVPNKKVTSVTNHGSQRGRRNPTNTKRGAIAADSSA